MNRPIVISDEIIELAVAQFKAKMRSTKLAEGSINYTQKLEYGAEDKRKVNVIFTPNAYMKMLALVHNFTSEIAWHGTVQRTAADTFVINDILVYPQVVAGATVNTDQEQYQIWMNELDDDTFKALRFQGHSHVNMGVFASSTDLQHQSEIVSSFNRGDQFYIFMIINKKQEVNVWVYDMATNTLYENSSVDVLISGIDFDMDAFVKEARELAQEKKTTSFYNGGKGVQSGYSGGYYSGGYYGTGYYGAGYQNDMDDDDDEVPAKIKKASKSDKKAKKSDKKAIEEIFPPDDPAEDSDFEYDPSSYHAGSIWEDVQS